MLETVVGEVKLMLRLPPDVHAAIVEIAKQETRSLNGQLVYFLRKAVAEHKPS